MCVRQYSITSLPVRIALLLLLLFASIFVTLQSATAQTGRGGDPEKLFARPASFGRAIRIQDESPSDRPMSADGEAAGADDESDTENECESEQRSRLFGPLIPPCTGITIEPIYYGEFFNNARGGISTTNATEYLGLLDIAATLDFATMGSRLPGQFFMLVQHSHGRGISLDYVGDFQVVSNIDPGDELMQVSEYWWEFPLRDDRIRLRLGKQDLNTEFLVTELAGDFIQSSFGLIPTLAIPTYPNPSAAAVLMIELRENTFFRTGIWDGFPDGRNWGFSGTGSSLTIAEFQRDWVLRERFPGSIDFGAAYLSDGTDPDTGGTLPTGTSFYLQAEQIIYRENCFDPDDDQGLGIFVQVSMINGNRLELTEGLNAGLVYRGLIPCRDEDTCGLAVAHAHLRNGGTGQETATELFYKAQIRPWLSIQPDVQYIATPSGIFPDALVLGTRFEIAW